MTHVIRVDNVNSAFCAGWWWLRTAGVEEASRNGPVLVSPGPVMTEYTLPRERVLFSPVRDCNHVFHLMEALWMLAGEDKVGFLLKFNPRMLEYAESDGILHGAYGYRWKYHFGPHQLLDIINILKKDPTTRQAVLGMWDPMADLNGDWKDRPCNTHAYFDLRGGALNMTVCCRSNDMLWGAYGANAVHFSILQEVIANGVGARVGVYRQFSNNFHVYTAVPQVKALLAQPPYEDFNYYADKKALALPLLGAEETVGDLLVDAEDLVAGRHLMRTHFMSTVAVPLRDAYLARKAGAHYSIDAVPDCDWKLAFTQWVERRSKV